MLLVIPTLVLGAVSGYARGGRLGRVASARLRGTWAVWIAVAAQLALILASEVGGAGDLARRSLLAGSLVAVLAFGWANRSLPGVWLAIVGIALNAAVILPNGAMPVSAGAIAALGGEETIEVAKHQLLEDHHHLPWLADIIPVPVLRTVISVGDIALALGAGLLLHRLMLGPRGRHAAPYGVRAGSGASTGS